MRTAHDGFPPQEGLDFEYNFERDELAAHRVMFEEAVECFFGDYWAPVAISAPTRWRKSWA